MSAPNLGGGVELTFRRLDTALGQLLIIATDAKLARIFLPDAQSSFGDQLAQLGPHACEVRDLLPDLCERLTAYAAGSRVDFDLSVVAWPRSTLLQRHIWEACARIEFGAVTTYGDLARQVGRPGAARAVGTAMARNPVPLVVPCHRVLGAGGLGGYSAPGGLSFKRRLLMLEAAAMTREPFGRGRTG